jgi:hypothetical protein
MLAIIQFRVFHLAIHKKKLNIKIYKILILVGFYMGANLGVTLRDEHKLKVLRTVLSRMVGTKKGNMGGWRKDKVVPALN